MSGAYAAVNGLELYYEVHGEPREDRPPLVLLHGGLDWPRLVEKNKQLDMDWKGWAPDDVASITAPTLLIIGDADIVQPEHTVEMFRLLGGGVAGDVVGLTPARLAVLAGTTHITLVQRVDWLVSMVTEFLDAPMPEAEGDGR